MGLRKLTFTKHTIAATIVSYDSQVCSPDFSLKSLQTIFRLSSVRNSFVSFDQRKGL